MDIPERHKAWIKLFRPVTLIAPLVGGIFGLLMVYSYYGESHLLFDNWRTVGYVVATLVLCNMASNIINQIYDLDCDRINKPDRPIANGSIQVDEANSVAYVLYVIAVARAFTITEWFGLFVLLIVLMTMAYNFRPLRFKQRLWWNTVTQALSRGVFAVLAIWCVYGNPLNPVPWAVGSIITIFLLGGASIKDFPDYEGDKATGIRTLPTVYGREQAGAMVTPFLWLPIPVAFIFVSFGILPDETMWLMFLLLPMVFVMTSSLIWSKQVKVGTENDLSWICMYLWLAGAFAGFGVLWL